MMGSVAPMSLPERTVDLWVAAALATRFPNAEFWAPTQNDEPRNWDLATQVAGAKTVILKNKATVPNAGGTHRISIDRAQPAVTGEAEPGPVLAPVLRTAVASMARRSTKRPLDSALKSPVPWRR